jgi:hypothetical protein
MAARCIRGGSEMGAGMPSRWLRWFIVLFWLATTSWLFWHDLWPSWQPGEPPSLRPDDVDEVQNPTSPMTIFWRVQRQQGDKTESIFNGKTWVKYQRNDDTYTLHAELTAPNVPNLKPMYVAKVFKIDSMTSEYRVNRAGQLHSLEATVDVTPHWKRLGPELPLLLSKIFRSQQPEEQQTSSSSVPFKLSLWGEVRDNQFFAHCRADPEGAALAKPFQFDLPPTAVSHTGSVLMPLHPVNHIRGLHLGQSWRQPLVDPLRDAFASLPGFSGGVRWLQARVLPRPELLKMEDNETSCLVIEYTNDENETMGRTWVEEVSDRVLQQEAILDDGHWIMTRDLVRQSGRRHP